MPQSQAPEPSLGSVLAAIWSHKIVMILSLLLGIGASVGLYLLITPSFEASSSVIVTSGTDAGADKAGNTVELVTSQARVAESSDVIRDAINRIGAARLTAKPSLLDGLGGRLRVDGRLLRPRLQRPPALGRYSAGSLRFALSASHISDTIHQRLPSFISCSVLMPRIGWSSPSIVPS